MNAWLLALLRSDPVPVTKTFTSNQSFTVPYGVSSIDMSGKGAAGTPSDTGSYSTKYTTYLQRRDNGAIETVDGGTTYSSGVAPSDYCDPVQATPGNATYSSSQTCYDFTQASLPHDATTGASATGFGKTFPGGAGGAASVTSYPGVAVTQGAAYDVVVPAGGSITITYYQ